MASVSLALPLALALTLAIMAAVAFAMLTLINTGVDFRDAHLGARFKRSRAVKLHEQACSAVLPRPHTVTMRRLHLIKGNMGGRNLSEQWREGVLR